MMSLARMSLVWRGVASAGRHRRARRSLRRTEHRTIGVCHVNRAPRATVSLRQTQMANICAMRSSYCFKLHVATPWELTSAAPPCINRVHLALSKNQNQKSQNDRWCSKPKKKQHQNPVQNKNKKENRRVLLPNKNKNHKRATLNPGSV